MASFLYYFYEEMTVMKKWLSKNVLKSCKKKIKKVKDFFRTYMEKISCIRIYNSFYITT